MKVFAENYLEDFAPEGETKVKDWSWKPTNSKIVEIYASGKPTNTKTYKNQRDNDTDAPREGSKYE